MHKTRMVLRIVRSCFRCLSTVKGYFSEILRLKQCVHYWLHYQILSASGLLVVGCRNEVQYMRLHYEMTESTLSQVNIESNEPCSVDKKDHGSNTSGPVCMAHL